MLHAVRLRNYRSFVDTGDVELAKLNVFIGPNNAGKTSLVSAIELFLRSLKTGPRTDPLAFDEMSAFASFDSVLRRHWAPGEQRPSELVFGYRWSQRGQQAGQYDFTCRGQPEDNTSYVSSVSYTATDERILATRRSPSPGRSKYDVLLGDEKFTEDRLYFQGGLPLLVHSSKQAARPLLDRPRPRIRLEVIHPYRPVPRSYYVLDDPSLTVEDRELLSFLVRMWASEEDAPKGIRRRITSTLDILGLARQFDVHQISKRVGPKVFEIRVAPTIRRHRVTIADAGFGLSQALPLAAYDARLFNGHLIAYQPEVHLHPFAQSRLADVFLNSLKRENQIFVETHSPDLILRLQAQIANGAVSPESVRVMCVENKKGRSSVRVIDLDASGKPSIPWPTGFLDTSLSLARDLAAARVKK